MHVSLLCGNPKFEPDRTEFQPHLCRSVTILRLLHISQPTRGIYSQSCSPYYR
jgi:hypothetical protein